MAAKEKNVMRKVTVILALVACCVIHSVSAEAFDGKRKGFQLGFGLGGGFSHVTQKVTVSYPYQDSAEASEDHFGIASDFKLGAGITERFALYYVNRMNWFGGDNALGNSVIFTSSVGLVGGSYYLSEETPSMYLLGLVGVAAWDTPFEDSDPSSGFGMGIGVGWEFARHYSVEATVNYGSPSTDDYGISLDTKFTMVLITLNALAY
jgi:hypothetical protein